MNQNAFPLALLMLALPVHAQIKAEKITKPTTPFDKCAWEKRILAVLRDHKLRFGNQMIYFFKSDQSESAVVKIEVLYPKSIHFYFVGFDNQFVELPNDLVHQPNQTGLAYARDSYYLQGCNPSLD